MALRYGELMDDCERTVRAACDERDLTELHWLRACAGIINDVINQRGIRVMPLAKSPGVSAFLSHFRGLVVRNLDECGLGSYVSPAPQSTLATN